MRSVVAHDPLLRQLHTGSESGPIYLAISKDDRLLFVSEERAQRIGVFDLDALRSSDDNTKVHLGHIPTALATVGLAVSPDGKWLFATSEEAPFTSRFPRTCEPHNGGPRNHPAGILFVISTAKAALHPSEAVVAAIAAGCAPVRVAVSPSGKTVWVSARDDDELLQFNAEQLISDDHKIVSNRYKVGPSPVGIVVRPDGKQVWAAVSGRFDKNTKGRLAGIEGIDKSTAMKLMSAPASGFPRNLTFLPDGRTLLVTLFNAEKIEFMPTPR